MYYVHLQENSNCKKIFSQLSPQSPLATVNWGDYRLDCEVIEISYYKTTIRP